VRKNLLVDACVNFPYRHRRDVQVGIGCVLYPLQHRTVRLGFAQLRDDVGITLAYVGPKPTMIDAIKSRCGAALAVPRSFYRNIRLLRFLPLSRSVKPVPNRSNRRPMGLRPLLLRLLRVFALLPLLLLAAPAWAGVDWLVNNTDTGFDPVAAGGHIDYVVRVNNNGTTAAPVTTLTLAIPATTSFVSATGMTCSGTGPVTCAVPTLGVAGGAGDSASVTVRIRTTVLGTVNLGASIPTTVGATVDTDGSNNSAGQATTVNAGADIGLTLTGLTSAQSGSTVSYTFRATNHGPDAAGPVRLSFPTPAGLTSIAVGPGCALGTPNTCDAPSLAVGVSRDFNFTGRIMAASGSTV